MSVREPLRTKPPRNQGKITLRVMLIKLWHTQTESLLFKGTRV